METQASSRLSDYDFALPESAIARYPLPHREASKMMVIHRQDEVISHRQFTQLIDYLNPGDAVVLNNAKVIPARLKGHREGHTGHVELFLLHPENEERSQWQALMRPARRLKSGTKVVFPTHSEISATIIAQGEMGQGQIRLNWPAEIPLDDILNQIGEMPIPPYLARKAEASDNDRYQTVFAKAPGAQAAPTAGLHFTPEILHAIRDKGVHIAEITLNVGAGTFRPVLSETIEDHRMDAEFYTMSEEAAQQIEATRQAGRKVVAIGTTVAKTLETVAAHNQGKIVAESRWSELFITPGFQFQVVDTLLTNFHLPKSTLLMLVSAFSSRELMLKAYQAAIQNEYRFYSYGDCMLIQ